MCDEYEMISTSASSARIASHALSESSTTRLVVNAEVVQNTENPDAGVKITLAHQRKSVRDEWEDVETIDLRRLRGGEGVRLSLNTATTLRLFEELRNLYAISDSGGVRSGENRLVVGREDEVILADPTRARHINHLLARRMPEELWEALSEVNPQLVAQWSHAEIHRQRVETTQSFAAHLNDDQWTEPRSL